MTSGLKSDNYDDKLKEVGLRTLKQRRLRGDMVQTWKILTGHDNVDDKTWTMLTKKHGLLEQGDGGQDNQTV